MQTATAELPAPAAAVVKRAVADELASLRFDYFTAYQWAFIADPSPLILVEKGRREGFSYAASFRAVRLALGKPDTEVWICSRDGKTAKEFLRYCKKWCRCANVLSQGLYSIRAFVVDPKKGTLAECISFSNGSRIMILTSNPDALAGKGGHIILDEFALHKAQEQLLEVAMPCLDWGGSLCIISTCRRRCPANVHQQLCDLARAKRAAGLPSAWSFHSVNILQAIAGGLVEAQNRVTGKNVSRDNWLAQLRARVFAKPDGAKTWEQEYMCNPQDDDGAVLPLGIILPCEVQDIPGGATAAQQIANVVALAEKRQCPVYAGLDVARSHDLTALIMVALVGDIAWLIYTLTLSQATLDVHKAAITEAWARFNPVRLWMDQSLLGTFLHDELLRRYGGAVVGLKFSDPAVKEGLVISLGDRFRNRTLRIPPNDDTLRNDLHSVEKITRPSGWVAYNAPRTGAGHGDRFWGLAMAVGAAGGVPPLIAHEPVGHKDVHTGKTVIGDLQPHNDDDYGGGRGNKFGGW